MALFDGFRRKRDEPATEVEESESGEPDTDEEPVDGPSTWYRKIYVSVVPAGDDVLLHDPERTAPIVLPTFELDLLEQCTRFATVEEHAAAAARRSGLPADALAHRLYELVDRGLLISQQEVVGRAHAAASADSTTPPILNRVAVITGNRPESLGTCLQSYRERYGADLELIVFDDSGDPATREENRRVALRSGSGGQVFYAGEDEKRRLVAALAKRSGVDEDVVRAAVWEFDGCDWHTGANRNAALLDAAGGTVLMVDDDTTARAASPAAASDDFRLSSRHDPLFLRLFAQVEDALGAAEWQDVNLLASHSRYLGRSPAACAFAMSGAITPFSLEEHAVRMDLNEADTPLLAGFGAGRGRVVASSAGIVGDSGMSSSLYFLLLQGAARERMLEDYDSHRTTRAVLRGADIATVSNSRFLMTPHVAFDVRATIPPFSPVLRNEDAVFGDLLRTCSPESFMAFLPWAVEHRPPVPRSLEFDQVLRSVGRVGGNTLICQLARAYEPGVGVTDPGVRLRIFGQYLAALGTMPPGDFDLFVRHQITEAIGRRIDQLTSALNRESGLPERWGEDCSAAVAEGLRSLTEEPLVVSDIPGASADERNRRFQRLLLRFGRLIDAWPTLLEAAKDLRVAEPIRAP